MALSQTDAAQLEQSIALVERTIRIVRWVAIGLVASGLIVGIYGVLRFKMKPEEMAGLGDYLGGTTGVLWSLAGLTLVYVAFLGQQLQILHQKEDLRLTREAFYQQREEMQLQTEGMENQRFDNTFFALLAAHQDLVKECDFDVGKGVKTGTEGFEALLDKMTQRYHEARAVQPNLDSLEIARRVYLEHYKTYERTLGPYFHSLFHIIKFVDDRALPIDRSDERRRYTNFVRARLSFAELIVLFYSGLTEQGAGMKSLIERHALMKHLGPERLFDPSHRNAYRPSAYARPVTRNKDVASRPMPAPTPPAAD